MDAKKEELRLLGALIKITNLCLEDARKDILGDSVPGRRALIRVQESLVDCMRKGIAELRPVLVALIESELRRCDDLLFQRRQKLTEGASAPPSQKIKSSV